MLGILGWTLVDGYQAVRHTAEQQAGNIALTLEGGISRDITSLDLSMRAAAKAMQTPDLDAMDLDVKRQLLFDGSVAADGVSGLLITDEKGSVTYNSLGEQLRTVGFADRDYFQAHLRSPDLGLLISPPLQSRYTSDWNIPLSRRINHVDGSFAGVVVAGLRLSFFQSMFHGLNVGQHGAVSLYDIDGMLIAREPPLAQVTGRDRTSGVFRTLPSAPAGIYEARSQVDGVRRIYSYRRLGSLPLAIVVGLSTEEVYAEWFQKAVVLGGLTLLLLVIGSMLGFALRRELRGRARAEEAERRSAQQHAAALMRLDMLFRNSADALFIAGAEPGRFWYEAVNPVWEALTGLSNDEVAGKSPQAYQPDHLARIVLAAWQECVQTRAPVRYNYQLNSPAGRLDWETVVSPVLDGEGRVSRLIGVKRDVTERHRLHAALLQSQRLEAVGQLTTGVAHDFNNLLQAILGNLDILQEEHGLSREAQEGLSLAEGAAKRAATLVHRLLAFSRKQALEPVPLRPAVVLADVSELLARTLGARVQVEVAVRDGVWPVFADAAQLDNCLFNLVLNARDAMAGAGLLRLHADNAGPDAARSAGLAEGDYVRLSVEDSGSGMTPDTLARVFEPFFTTKEVGKGTGLGLSMVQGFARQSGGDVRIDSVPGQGTTVSLWLPRAAEVLLSIHPVVADHAKGCVLVVEDEPAVRQTLSRFLSKAGFLSMECGNAESALAVLRSGQACDLLITDQSMPGMSGSELIAEVTRIRPTMPIILVTGYDMVSGIDQLPTSVTVLRKPFGRATLIGQVETLLGNIAGTRAGVAKPASA